MKVLLQKTRNRIARMREAFQRKPNRFLTHLIEQTTILVHGTEALNVYMTKPSKKNAARVRTLEKQADEVRRILIDDLNRTFVTPIDREDLFALSRAIDDIMDYAYSTTNEMDVLGVVPNDYLRSMAALLHQSSEELHLAIERLEHHPKIATDHSVRVKSIENQMEILYAEALAHLFDEPKDLKDVITMFKLREIYRHMFHAVGSTEQAADIVGDIVIKFY